MSGAPAAVSPGRLEDYLARVWHSRVEVVAVRPLGGGDTTDPKGFGYGTPLEVECVVDGERRHLVVSRTRPAQGFGHDYPADRAWQALYGHVAYNSFPRHVRSVDVGFIRSSGALVSAADAVEFFQLVEKAGGELYWRDLDRLLHGDGRPTGLDVERAETLGRFLAEAHAMKHHAPALYERRIRELVAHGECAMGIIDSYPHPYALLPPEDCEALERQFVGWRWRLRDRTHRLSRVHGDFHPWNLLFRRGTDFSVLDRSRGEWGEPADDVAALGINYLFFAVRRAAALGTAAAAEPLRGLFRRFLGAYLTTSGDHEVLETLPPFFAFRALVVAHPRWYPTLPDGVRTALLDFARRVMTAPRFAPGDLDRLFEPVR